MAVLSRRVAWVGAALLLNAACQGILDGGDPLPESPLGAGGGPPAADPTSVCDGAFLVGPASLRRLNRSEYANTLTDLFGTSAGVETELPVDNVVDGYDNNAANASVSQLRADRMFGVVEELAETVTADLTALLPCDESAVSDDCVDSFIRTTGKRVYRRPLSEAEEAVLRGVYDDGMGDPTEERVGMVLRAMLMSPQALYRFEFGDPDAPSPGSEFVALSGYEIATRLSYLMWSGPPSEGMLLAAEQGALDTAEGIETQLRSMLSDPRTVRGMLRFLTQWIDLRGLEQLTRDATTYPNFTPELLASMREQTVRFLEEQAITGDASAADLLTASTAPVDSALAALYGVEHPTGEGWQSVALPSEQRSGILTHVGFLTNKAHAISPAPVQRGIYVRTRLLCQDIPAPPDDVDTTIEETGEAITNRELLAQHSSDPACFSCHQYMDPIGFGFENYDSIGAFRTTDHGLPVDASGELLFTEDVDGVFDGAIELSARLAGSEQVAACMAKQLFRFGFGRRLKDPDACSMDQVLKHAETYGDAIKELMIAVAVSDSFRFKPVDALADPGTSSGGGAP